MSTYYRFRPAERLLGRPESDGVPARQGELDDLTMYFASPHELNDPLEGHRETYFEGDLIVWCNLVKHYTLLLFASTGDVYLRGGDGSIKDINLRPENFEPTQKQVFERILDTIFSSSPINSYIESIAHSNRKISRFELSVHLATLHNSILIYMLLELDKTFDIPDISNFERPLKSTLDYVALRSLMMDKEGPTPDMDIYRNIKSKIKQQALRGNAARTETLDVGRTRLFVHFPDEFSAHVDYLIYPYWYVACFMKECSNSAIWGTYGDNHKGVCLIYKAKKYRGSDCLSLHKLPFEFVQAYNYGRPKDQYYLNMPLQLPLIEVKYTPNYTRPNFFTSLFNENKDWALSYWYKSKNNELSPLASWLNQNLSDLLPEYKNHYQQSLTTKTAHWQNEIESRIIISGLRWEQQERQVRYSFSELEGLIFGINTPDEIKVKVIKKIAFHCAAQHRSDFKFYQARFNDTYSEIKHDLLEHITFNQDGTLNLTPNIG